MAASQRETQDQWQRQSSVITLGRSHSYLGVIQLHRGDAEAAKSEFDAIDRPLLINELDQIIDIINERLVARDFNIPQCEDVISHLRGLAERPGSL